MNGWVSGLPKWMMVGVSVLILVACQSTTTTTTPTNYQGTAPSKRTQDKTELAKIRTQLAAQMILEKKLDAAQRQLESAFEADRNYAPAYDMMGVLLQTEGSKGNVAKADEYFRRAIGMDPNFMQARNNYGVYLMQQKKYNAAIAQFEIAGSALGYEGRVKSLENLGIAYKKIGNTAKAKGAFIKAIEANPSTVVARIELIDIYLAEGNITNAKKLYGELEFIAGKKTLPPNVLLQGIKLAVLQGDQAQRQALSQSLLATYPLSDEAKRLKVWLSDTSKPLK